MERLQFTPIFLDTQKEVNFIEWGRYTVFSSQLLRSMNQQLLPKQIQSCFQGMASFQHLQLELF